MMKNIAVITGASSGIGKQFALLLEEYDQYDELWVIARNQENLQLLSTVVPFPIKTFALDLTKAESFDVYRRELEQEKPNIKLLVNASGFGIFESTENTKMEDAEGMIDLNCKALVKMSMLSIPYMSKGSKIVEIASIAAFQPVPYINIYGASKAFVLSFSRALNQEVKEKGIHVMAVCPYWTKTQFFDRAADKNNNIIKKYVVMYEPEKIVRQAFKDLNKGKDKSIYGMVAKGQAALCKILPHSLIMKVWMRQQDL